MVHTIDNSISQYRFSLQKPPAAPLGNRKVPKEVLRKKQKAGAKGYGCKAAYCWLVHRQVMCNCRLEEFGRPQCIWLANNWKTLKHDAEQPKSVTGSRELSGSETHASVTCDPGDSKQHSIAGGVKLPYSCTVMSVQMSKSTIASLKPKGGTPAYYVFCTVWKHVICADVVARDQKRMVTRCANTKIVKFVKAECYTNCFKNRNASEAQDRRGLIVPCANQVSGALQLCEKRCEVWQYHRGHYQAKKRKDGKIFLLGREMKTPEEKERERAYKQEKENAAKIKDVPANKNRGQGQCMKLSQLLQPLPPYHEVVQYERAVGLCRASTLTG